VSVLPTRFYQYEYLFLVRGQRREVILSEFYHKNYAELKSAIMARVENLTKREYHLADEFKVIIN
ncbi:hypothetical protein, partial [Umezakia ovalisporum]|uniref:hypothetical protein n=1 Tax=Umezakia ovalisporum TaxID=75695 RepID=UPI0039C75FF2